MALSKIKTNSLLDDAVTAAKIATGTIVAADLAANSVDSSELVDGSIDASHIASSAVTNVKTNFQPGTTFKGDGSSTDGKITLNCSQNTHGVSIQSPAHASAATYTLTLPTSNGNANEFLQTNGSGVLTFATVGTSSLAADAVDGTKLADNAVDSEHYTDGSIDNAHIADDQIDSEHYVDGSIDTAHIADNQVTLAKMAGLARGKIIYGDASGDPAALTVGSSGQVLKSDGTDISWGASPGAALTGSTNNTITTVTGANAFQGEANLTFDGSTLAVTGATTVSTTLGVTGVATFSGGATLTEGTLTDQATVTWDAATDPVAKVTLGANRTLASATNGGTGQFISLLVIQDGTGSRTLTWNAAYEFKDDTAPTLTTTAAKGDLFVFRYNGSKWLEVGRNTALTLS